MNNIKYPLFLSIRAFFIIRLLLFPFLTNAIMETSALLLFTLYRMNLFVNVFHVHSLEAHNYLEYTYQVDISVF